MVAGLPAPGVGLPRRYPCPENGWYLGLGLTYFSSCCRISTSTSWPRCTFMIERGARPCRIPSRISAFRGSSERYRSPSSTEKPSAQKCRVRCTRCGIWGAEGTLAGSITRLGVSSPPRVRAAPVKCDCRGWDSSEAGSSVLCWSAMWNRTCVCSPIAAARVSYLVAFSMIFFLISSGFWTASPDFSPPAKRSWFTLSSSSEESPPPDA